MICSLSKESPSPGSLNSCIDTIRSGQLADAALVYLAERDHIRSIFTLDQRDFSIYRLKRNRALRIIPELS